MGDSRGALIKVRADKRDADVITELWEVAQDLGWPDNASIMPNFGGRSRLVKGWTISDGGRNRKEIIRISSDPVGITYCVPPHPDHVEVKRVMGVDIGERDVTAIIAARHEDGTVVVEEAITASAEKVIEVARNMGVSIEEAGLAFRAALTTLPSAGLAIANLEKAMRSLRGKA